MIGYFTKKNFAPKTPLVAIIDDLRYRNNLYQKKQQKQFSQTNINFRFTSYLLKYYNTTANGLVSSSNLADYIAIDIDDDLETFFEVRLSLVVASGAIPAAFVDEIFFVITDGVNVLQNDRISSLVVPNTILNLTTLNNFKLLQSRSRLFIGLFINDQLTLTQKNYIDANLVFSWSLVINQNNII